jgi:hypothetical protein
VAIADGAEAVGGDFGTGRDAAMGDVDGVAVGEFAGVVVGAGERVDGVVVASVGERGELVEEVLGVLVADDPDEAVAPAAAATGWARMNLCPVTRSARAL